MGSDRPPQGPTETSISDFDRIRRYGSDSLSSTNGPRMRDAHSPTVPSSARRSNLLRLESSGFCGRSGGRKCFLKPLVFFL